MKTWPDRSSPWGKRIRFEEAEFEAMMDDLRYRAGNCFVPGKGVNVDQVLLFGVGVEADYVDLPSGVMGCTHFHPDGSVKIEVSRELVDAAERDTISRRRLRTTLAHECGHFACHSTLFIRDSETISLFEADAGERRSDPILCRHEGMGATSGGYSGQWWEFQANQCMAALLMPRKMFGEAARRTLVNAGHESFDAAFAAHQGEELIESLSGEFDVSLEATFYRLQALGFVPRETQPSLRLQ